MKSITIIPYTKQLLAKVLGCSNQSLARYIATNKSKILEVYPDYKETDKKIHPVLFKFICGKNGLDEMEIAARIKEVCPEYEAVDIEKIARIYGYYQPDKLSKIINS